MNSWTLLKTVSTGHLATSDSILKIILKHLKMDQLNKILETHLMPNGLEIDLDEGFEKLTERQFGGNPGRAFSELIQNAIDSYPNGTPWEERMGEICSGPDWISIKDYGEGMDSDRLMLLITLGGSDKHNDPQKIGQFGMGFMSMFNRKLGTREVSVKTRCEGQTVQLVFKVKERGKRPEISICDLKEQIPYSTLIRVEFDHSRSVSDCMAYARKSLTYYPCKMKINGELFATCWEHHSDNDSKIFREDNCHGLIKYGTDWRNINVLCKYESIMKTSFDHFITGGRNVRYNLEDYHNSKTPYITDIEVVLNANNLNVTISRDSFYLDFAYYSALGILNRNLKAYLLGKMKRGVIPELILANQFIFRNEISEYLKNPGNYMANPSDENRFIEELSTASVYRINGRIGKYSLMALKSMKRDYLPFFFSPERTNLRWLGGSFKHDYVVVTDSCRLNGGAPGFYDSLFFTVFKDIVNLDTIPGNHKRIMELVDREIINKEALSPKTKIIGIRNLNPEEQNLLKEIDALLGDQGIMNVIETNLHMKVKSIESAFFDMEETGCRISSGLFDENGKPLNEKFISNFLKPAGENENQEMNYSSKARVLLGLNLKHPFIQYLLSIRDSQRNYYGLTYLAHELALCQKMLVPYSPFYHLVKQKLAQDMRKALIKNLLARINN